MTDKIEEATRKKVAEIFPAISKKVLGDYQNLINAGAQSFVATEHPKAYYEACKAAVAHLQLLLKLGQWAEVSPEKSGLAEDKLADMVITLESQAEAQSAAFDDEGEMA